MLRRCLERLGSGLAQQGTLGTYHLRGAKRSTFLTGIPVDEKAEVNTPAILDDVLKKAALLPDGVAYRSHVEKYCNTFLAAIREAPSQADAEEKLGRQFEEIQLDCKKELELIDRMLQWKPWEVPSDHEIAMFTDVKDIPSNVRRFREYQAQVANRS